MIIIDEVEEGEVAVDELLLEEVGIVDGLHVVDALIGGDEVGDIFEVVFHV